jgi:simple sugar transport system permease protein
MAAIPQTQSITAWYYKKPVQVFLRYLVIFCAAFFLFGIILWIAGKNPLQAIQDTLAYTLGTASGFSEVIVRMIPLLFTAIAVALPARVGLINVGAEGQLYIGAMLAAGTALAFPNLPAWLLLPCMVVAGLAGGALWAFIPVFLRARGWVNETITTLLMNYVAPTIVSFVVYGPWRARGVASAPQTVDFSETARLPSFFDTRVHLGLLLGLVILAAYWYVMKYTRWGLEMRAVGGNPQAARRNGINWTLYLIAAMCIGGAVAGLAGMSEISGIHGRLRPNFSPGFGYTGFLINWLSFGSPIGILLMSFVIAIITSGGDILQIKQGLPYAVLNILLAITLYVVLARPTLFERKKV